ncbi:MULTISPECIES: DUF4257 domain-containing protein [Mesobacillus]|uniref:DUF4257 domain-containing protein n=1 Tax=Mesobacillus selenatarsenatis TaxID=388741 RepID=A0A846TIC6_9BACI|nr:MULTISPECIES: DUF4257 domain-containing protein [Mesobacillus]NKE06539.1 DUF4257 domain-containing protein [Mesobacillus selenatarsenatis]
MLENIIFALVIGGFVGLTAHVRRRGKIIMPRRTKKFIYLGFFEEILTGSLAAALLVVSSEADSLLRVFLMSIMAGFGGDALLRGLELFRIGNSSQVREDIGNEKTNTSA